MRTYVYSDEKLHGLFAVIVNRLSDDAGHAEMIQSILKDICVHFRFGCGFIYEVNHTGHFDLREYYSSYDNAECLPNSMLLEDHLSGAEIARLKEGRTAIIQLTHDESMETNNLTRLFSANSILLTPVLADGDKLVGLVAMIDRRHQILLDSASIKAAQTVLKLVGNHVRLRSYQMRLEYAHQSLVSVMDHMGIDIYVNDFDTHEILYLNRSMAAPYGGLEKMMGRKCWEVLYDDKTGECDFCPRTKLIDEEGKPTKNIYSWDYRRPFDGSWFRVLCAAFRWVDGRMAQVVSSVDITANKRNEETINRLANYDNLTQLPNRRKLTNVIEDTIRDFYRIDNAEAWIIFFDLDNFKDVNDTYGHQAGDELLEQIGWTLNESPLTKGCGYRFGGDEFAVFKPNVDRIQVNRILDFLLGTFDKQWLLKDDEAVSCQASFGIARFPNDAQSAEILIRQADLAMYKAKEAGKGQAVFTSGEFYQRRS
ncbi:GGDEF domain-containing protein [Deltaproteobacteria bacterium Smac51]|nr:GGDEF domain-containing protein [Deltaproteobacteria bacterium Smac51]